MHSQFTCVRLETLMYLLVCQYYVLPVSQRLCIYCKCCSVAFIKEEKKKKEKKVKQSLQSAFKKEDCNHKVLYTLLTKWVMHTQKCSLMNGNHQMAVLTVVCRLQVSQRWNGRTHTVPWWRVPVFLRSDLLYAVSCRQRVLRPHHSRAVHCRPLCPCWLRQLHRLCHRYCNFHTARCFWIYKVRHQKCGLKVKKSTNKMLPNTRGNLCSWQAKHMDVCVRHIRMCCCA